MNNTYDMISTFLETVEKNLESKNFTIDSMQNIFYSSSNFTKIFKRFFNITPVNYIKKRKLSEIAKRLRISNDSILDIALDYEYSNPSSFERAFRREFGISASQYRKEVDLSTNLYEAININGDNLRNMILGNPYYSPLAYFLDELFGLKPKSTMVK